MEEFVRSGSAVDLALCAIAVECAAVLVLKGYRKAGSLALTLGAGASLLLALRAALTGAEWVWIAAWMAAAMPLHLLDLWLRARSRG